MKTLRMPECTHATRDTESALEILDQCCMILSDYRKAGYPVFPNSEPFVERLMALGVTYAEAVEMLAVTSYNAKEVA